MKAIQIGISERESVSRSREFTFMTETTSLMPLIPLLLSGALLVACTNQSTNQIWFSDEAEERGVEFMHKSGFVERPYLPEIVGGGVALLDVEDDGDLDLYFVQGGFHLASEGSETSFHTDELYLNDGEGRFTFHPHRSDEEQRLYGMGATAGDYDNDGDTDLYITNVGANELLQNDGSGNFTDVAIEAGVDDQSWSTAATFTDFDNDGDLDLFVTNYLRWSARSELDCYARGVMTYCLPTNYKSPAQDILYRNNGDGTFSFATYSAGLPEAFGNGLGVVPADFDGNGYIDVFVANDTMVNQLWLNQGNWRFKDYAYEWGCAVDNHGFAKAGMGVDAADVDNDDDQDVLVVNLEGQTDSFFVNQKTYFRDQTSRASLGSGSRRFTRFGVVLADFDNDTVLDLYEANGKVDGNPKNADDEFAEPNTLFRGSLVDNGLHFEPLATPDGTENPQSHTSRGLAIGDIDRDGDLDVVIANRDARPYVLVNQVADDTEWIRFRVLNRFGSDAIGATVSLTIDGKRQIRYVKVAGSYLASHDPHVHFGLGRAKQVEDVVVRWPTGEKYSIDLLESRQFRTVQPPSAPRRES